MHKTGNRKQLRNSSNVNIFHVPNLIPPINYIKQLTFKSIKSNISNLGQPLNYV